MLPRLIIERHCKPECERLRIEIFDILNNFFELNKTRNSYVESAEWYQNFKQIKVTGLSGQHITVVKIILKQLSRSPENPNKPTLRDDILQRHNIGSADVGTEQDQNRIVMDFLDKLGIFSTIRYVMCITLLTGGKQLDGLDLTVLLELLANARLTFEDFFSEKAVFRGYEIAMQSGNVGILLSVLGSDKFKLIDVIQKNILHIAIEEHRADLIQKIMTDLSPQEILQIPGIVKKVESLPGGASIQPYVELINTLMDNIAKYLTQWMQERKSKCQNDVKFRYAEDLLKAVEQKKENFHLYHAHYNSFRGFLILTENSESFDQAYATSSHSASELFKKPHAQDRLIPIFEVARKLGLRLPDFYEKPDDASYKAHPTS
jgi:hypothetical protein